MERSGQVRHRQEGDSARGLALLDSETRETLGRRRWRQPPLTRPALVLALTFVCVLHALFALALWYEMRPGSRHRAEQAVDSDRALIVRLIDRPSEPRAVQPTEPAALPGKPVPPRPVATAPASPMTHEKPRRDAMVVQDHEATPAPAASVATPSVTNLLVHVPTTTEPAPATASAKAEPAKPADDRQIMQHDSNRMQYKATRFEKYFPPPNETAGGAVGRHIGDALKEIAKSVCDPAKSSTATNLLCAAPPPPASPMDRDERLNLPPAPLADNPNPPKGPSLESCIAEYKSEQPLSAGCPVNTPDLAFKAEMRECIDLFRAGKRLKTWCPLDTPQRAAAEVATPAASSSAALP
ncbi:MAG TPA: hypothetical protein VFG49_14925 [Dyella sp.]|uniref:hypothetical protein n=1 Tax=Dyella sp. TaxID=1869338 RepID=UPI002D765E81|nr:hypothetical protein [Dyella sp.]HET6554817.1 hypothetical protein [Dyella sp.]